MSNASKHVFAQGKVVYWVRGNRFYNSGKGKNDARSKAEEYCLDNFLDFNKEVIKFDSDTECDYYEYLLKRQNANEISNLSHHFVLRVQEQFENANGDIIPEITYNADFIYLDLLTNKKVVVDVKSSEYFLTNDGGRFVLLKSVFDKVFKEKGYYIQIILRNGKDSWREWHIGDKKKSGKQAQQYRNKIKDMRKQINEQEKENRLVEREKARIIELRQIRSHGKLTSQQAKRLKELEAKYSI